MQLQDRVRIKLDIKAGELEVDSPASQHGEVVRQVAELIPALGCLVTRGALESEREAIKAIVAEHAAFGRSFGVEDICDKIIAAINARSEREG